jgi:hypothetical protein
MSKKSKHLIAVLTFLCLCLNTKADKIEKKGNILNSNCNPIGSKCNTKSTTSVATTIYVYNEPKRGSFSIQYTDSTVENNEALFAYLHNKRTVEIEEAIEIPADVILELNMPEAYIVPTGTYSVSHSRDLYTIHFVK